MKLVIEKWDGAVYVYRETNKHHRKTEKHRTTPRLEPKLLDADCDITGRGDFHMVFDLKKPKKRR